MNFLVVILLASCVIIGVHSGCQLSPCEGITRSGQSICTEYGLGQYIGTINRSGCKWDTSRVECCLKVPSAPGCQWSETCWGTAYNHENVCNQEFGSGFRPGARQQCSVLGISFECCPK